MSGLTQETTTASFRGRHGLLFLLTLLYVDTFIGRQIMAVMIEPIKQEFNASDTAMGLISGLAFAGVFALFGLSAGQLADRVSRTRLLVFCALLWSLTTFFCGMATGFFALIIARMLVAVAESPISASSLSLIADLYPLNRRAFAISCYSSAPTFATIIAMSLGAWVVEQYGWRMGFMLVAAPAVIIAGIFFFFTTEPERGLWDKPEPSHSVDHIEKGQDQTTGLKDSLRALFQQKSYLLLVLSSAITTMGANAYGMWNATFLVRSHGLELQDAGILTGVVAGGSAAIGMIFSGWLADHLISRDLKWQLRLPQLGHLIGLVAMLTYLLSPKGILLQIGHLPVPTAMIWCAINGFFAVWWVGACFSFLTHIVPANKRALAIAVQTILITLCGVGLGPFIIGLLSDLLAPSMATESLRYALIFCALTTVVAMVLLTVIRNQQSKSHF